MPPNFPPTSNLPPIGLNPRPPKATGPDVQTKNIVLFAIIFSVLATVVGLFFIFKPHQKAETASTLGTTTAQTATSTKAKGNFFSSFFKFNLFPSGSNSPGLNMFGPPSRSTSTSKTTNTTGQTSTTKTTTKPPAATNTSASAPTDKLEGIYGELSSGEAQLDLEFFTINIPSSPLRGQLWISVVKRSTKVDGETLTISTKNTLPTGTNVTGMSIKSVVSGQIVQIGQGVYLPMANQVNGLADIKILPGQKIIVATTHSPLGYSFRLNKCTGYFEQFQNFTPSLPQSCPRLKDETRPAPPNQLSDACLDYIDRFPACKIITTQAAPITPTTDQGYDCLKFVQDNTGYQNCSDLHRYDANFYSNEWRTYLNYNASIWKSKREIIWLLDQQGRFISQYSY